MGRARAQRVQDAAKAVVTEDERVTSTGTCWAAQLRGRVPLLLLGRRRYVVALTDRRVLVFERGRGAPEAADLVIGKRYETFALERVRRLRPLLQVLVRAANGNRMVFEFRPRQRELGGELIARLTPPPRKVAAAPGADRATGPGDRGTRAEREAMASFWGRR